MNLPRNFVVGVTLLAAATALAAEHPTINRRTGLYEPSVAELRKAAERRDRAELARAASRLGPNRLGKALADSDRRTALAALEAAPLFAEGVLLLDGISSLTTSTDDEIRHQAIRSIAALLHEHDRASLGEWEVSNETVGGVCQALLRAASNDSEKIAARLSAIEGLADASTSCTTTAALLDLLGKGSAEIRRAALLALPADNNAAVRNAIVAATKDADGKVTAAAGARLCRAQIQAANATPLRQLALASEALPEDVVDMLPCLAASKDPADRKVIEQLAATGSPAVKAAIKSLK